MSVLITILRVVGIVLLAVIILCCAPRIISLSFAFLRYLLGCNFSSDTSTTVFCESAAVRNFIAYGTLLDWYSVVTLPLALIAAGAFSVVMTAYLLVRASGRQ